MCCIGSDWTAPLTPGKARQDRGGFQIMGSIHWYIYVAVFTAGFD